MFDPTYRPGDNLYTNSAISWNPENGNMNWYFQYTPGDLWDYDEVGTHILIDRDIAGQLRKLVTHSARNGFLYTMDRINGQITGAKPYMEDVNWTKGIDQKTGKPLDYDPAKDVQVYAGVGNFTPSALLKKVCPSPTGGNNYWPSSYSPETKLLYIPALTGCAKVQVEPGTAVDPITFEIKKNVHLRYPNYSGTLSTGGGLVFLAQFDGTVAAFDDTTLEQLWKINVGSSFSAPPMTFEVNGKQYVAIASGPSITALRTLREFNPPELREMRQATVLYVFGL
jgi:alcohol dehydrogenase (cytochrome c)